MACSGPVPSTSIRGTLYCSQDCRRAADAARHQLARRGDPARDQRIVAIQKYRLWLLGFQREVCETAPRSATGYQLGARIREGELFWFPSCSGRNGKKMRRTLTLQWAKAVGHFTLDPFEQPWIPKAGNYRVRYVIGDRPQPAEESFSSFIPYGVPIWDLPFRADELITEGP